MIEQIKAQVAFGSRAIGTDGHAREIEWIEGELRTYGLSPRRQQWHELVEGKATGFTNIIASLQPEAEKRIVLGAHFDTIARAYRDKSTPDAVMPGANNGASGVALLLELARRLSSADGLQIGIDFAFFDGEEGPRSFGGDDESWRAVGSPYFAASLSQPEDIASTIIFDMVCYRHSLFRPEMSSIAYARSEVDRFWKIATGRNPALFSRVTLPYAINDDHTAFINAGVPAFLVIGFNYEPWFNTALDTPDKCSADVLSALADATMVYIEDLARD
jgi:Zn-dependent M28 family amino/carboxypeptidase